VISTTEPWDVDTLRGLIVKYGDKVLILYTSTIFSGTTLLRFDHNGACRAAKYAGHVPDILDMRAAPFANCVSVQERPFEESARVNLDNLFRYLSNWNGEITSVSILE
jgi:hypothetical protein